MAAERKAREEAAKEAAALKQAQEQAIEAAKAKAAELKKAQEQALEAARAKAAAEKAAAERAAAREKEERRVMEERAAAKTRHIEEHGRMFEAMQVHEASGGSGGAAASSSSPRSAAEFEPERQAAGALVVPEIFLCPITTELMRDPVSTVDGLTYERSAIETWLATNDTSPLTGKQLASPLLIPNVLVRGEIRELLEQHPGLDV